MKPIYRTDDLDDRPDIKNSEEIEAIPFAWTPELVRLSSSRFSTHPLLGPIEPSQDWPFYTCQPVMPLPDPADTRECLKWFGLSDEKIIQVEHKFNELYPDFQGPACGFEEQYVSKGYNRINFPVLDKMVDVYFGMLDQWSSDYEYTHEGYIKKAIQQGLRPEFAAVCGMHKDDPRCVDDPLLFERDWFDRSPSSIITDVMDLWWTRFKDFLTCKLVDEGKAWNDDHGQWLVHEGESMDQAKARVHNLDLEELRKQAYKEEREKIKRESEEYRRKVEREVADAEAEYKASRAE